MKFSTILQEWDKDKEVDLTKPLDMTQSAALHSKYLSWYFAEKGVLLELEESLSEKKAARVRWYRGEIQTEQELAKYGFQPRGEAPIKAENILNTYLSGDDYLKDEMKKIKIQNMKVEALDMIIKFIPKRSDELRSFMAYKKFSDGG